MTDRELMGQALDVLEDIFGKNKIDVGVINRLRERLEQPIECMCGICKLGQRQWQGLTDEEIAEVISGQFAERNYWVKITKALEAKLKEKNT